MPKMIEEKRGSALTRREINLKNWNKDASLAEGNKSEEYKKLIQRKISLCKEDITNLKKKLSNYNLKSLT